MRKHGLVLGWSILAGVAFFGGAACSTETILQGVLDDAGTGTSRPGDGGGTSRQDGSPILVDDDGGTTGDGGTRRDASADDGGVTTSLPKDSGAIDAASFDGGSMCPGTAPTAADLDSAGGWNPPPALNRTGCSVSDINTFQNNFSTANTWTDLVAGLPTSCQTCLLSHEDDTQWNLIVTDATGQAGFINWGACYARAPYGSDACGKAVQYDEFCVSVSCSDCPDADYATCTQASSTLSACGANFSSAISTGCGTDTAKLDALDAACGGAAAAAKTLCANTLPDGGHP